jgi:hypothetical protein
MKIKRCSDFLYEKSPGSLWGSPDEWSDNNNLPEIDPIPQVTSKFGEGPDFLYHATEPEALDDILENGLQGDIYLTSTPEEAKRHHPIVLKINVKNRKLNRDREGWIVKDVPADQIEKM